MIFFREKGRSTSLSFSFLNRHTHTSENENHFFNPTQRLLWIFTFFCKKWWSVYKKFLTFILFFISVINICFLVIVFSKIKKHSKIKFIFSSFSWHNYHQIYSLWTNSCIQRNKYFFKYLIPYFSYITQDHTTKKCSKM